MDNESDRMSEGQDTTRFGTPGCAGGSAPATDELAAAIARAEAAESDRDAWKRTAQIRAALLDGDDKPFREEIAAAEKEAKEAEALGWKRALEKIEDLAGEFGSTPAECVAVINDYVGEALHAITQGKVPEPLPIDMVLHCPGCGLQHIDAPEPGTNWTNPPHRSHKCHGCGDVWRPADVPTNGVAAIETRGKADTVPTDRRYAAAVAEKQEAAAPRDPHEMAMAVLRDIAEPPLVMKAAEPAALAYWCQAAARHAVVMIGLVERTAPLAAPPALAVPHQGAAAQGLDTPWPLADVLDKLADATEHLLANHGCDEHGWEVWHGCVARARRYVTELRSGLDPPAAGRSASPSAPPAASSASPSVEERARRMMAETLCTRDDVARAIRAAESARDAAWREALREAETALLGAKAAANRGGNPLLDVNVALSSIRTLLSGGVATEAPQAHPDVAAAYARGLERAAQRASDKLKEWNDTQEDGDGRLLHEVVAEEIRALVATEAPAPPLDARDVLTELLRLYDWRFELAEREKDPRNTPDVPFYIETKRLLRQYGTEKKAAWAAARRALASGNPPKAAPSDLSGEAGKQEAAASDLSPPDPLDPRIVLAILNQGIAAHADAMLSHAHSVCSICAPLVDARDEIQARADLASGEPSAAHATPEEPIRLSAIITYRADDAVTISINVPGFTTIRACRHCGVLIAGGPNACFACANDPRNAEPPAEKPAPAVVDDPRSQMMIGEAPDGWHVVTKTYPALNEDPAKMDTACGKKMLPATRFETTDAARGHTFCIACLNAWPEPRVMTSAAQPEPT
jgi:hypothetical protein